MIMFFGGGEEVGSRGYQKKQGEMCRKKKKKIRFYQSSFFHMLSCFRRLRFFKS